MKCDVKNKKVYFSDIVHCEINKQQTDLFYFCEAKINLSKKQKNLTAIKILLTLQIRKIFY